MRLTHRANLWKRIDFWLRRGATVQYHLNDFWNDVTSATHDYSISYAHIFTTHLIFVV
jgi:hypothetical protein